MLGSLTHGLALPMLRCCGLLKGVWSQLGEVLDRRYDLQSFEFVPGMFAQKCPK